MDFTKPRHFSSVKEALASLFGSDTDIQGTKRIAGGDINEAYCLMLTDGTCIFMKANKKENLSFFTAEAAGLWAIASTGAVRTPRVLCTGTDSGRGGFSFLLMEYVRGKGRTASYWEVFAQELAAMHRAGTADFVQGGKYGFFQDNFIGARGQMNAAYESWVAFFRDCRLEPQFHQASGYFSPSDRKRINRLLERLDTFLAEPDSPSLLHGDLWSGNVITGNDGKVWLIDPAVYVGHAEADLAMTELFGGFPHSFYSAYKKALPLQPGYSHRRDLYNLYHLLNHLNMFGGSYLSSVQKIVAEYTG